MEELARRGLISIAFFTASLISIGVAMDLQGSPLRPHLLELVFFLIPEFIAIVWHALVRMATWILIVSTPVYFISAFINHKKAKRAAAEERIRKREEKRAAKLSRVERNQREEARKKKLELEADRQRALKEERIRIETERRKARSSFEATDEALDDFLK